MHVICGSNLWLVFSAILILVGGVALRAAAGRSRRWRWACIVCPLLAALAATLALAEPVAWWNPTARRVVILLDLSPSTRTSPWRDPQWLRTEALRHLAPTTRLTVVGFSDQPHVLLSDVTPGDALPWPVEWPPSGGGGSAGGNDSSNVAAALAWRADDESKTRALAPRWLITDGLFDAEMNPVPFSKGTGPFDLAVTTVAPAAVDVGIAEILIKQAAAGAPTELWVRVRATGPAQVDVDLFRDEERLVRQPVNFAGGGIGDRWISVRTSDLPADRPTRLTARLTPRPPQRPDPWPENDSAALLYLPDGPPRVLVVSQNVASGKSLQSVLTGAGLRPQTIRPAELPADSAALVAQGWQVVLLDNVPMKAPAAAAGIAPLSPEAAGALDNFVQETGGGLVLLGGRYAFGPGYYPDGQGMLEKLSPLASQPPKRPGAHVIFLLDASASMNEAASPATPDRKFSLVARGVESALELLQPQDAITVITFNSDSQVQASGLKADVEKAIEEKLRTIHPQGTTTPDTALPLLEPLLPALVHPQDGQAAAPSSTDPSTATATTMVVLLTDGEIPKIDLPAWKTLLSRSGAMLTVVAPTPSLPGEQDALPVLAQQNRATWLALDGAADWTILLRRAVAERLMGKARTEPMKWVEKPEARSQKPEGGDAPTTVGLAGTTSHWIETYMKADSTSRATGATAVAGRFATDWALAATARRGLGQVAALSLDADSPAAQALLAELTRDVAAPPGDRRFTLSARRDARGWRLRAEGHDDRGFLDGLQLRARILAASGDERLVDLPQTAPGTYEALIPPPPAPASGAFAAIITRDAGEGSAVVGTLRPPDVQTAEYPASVERTALPEGAAILPADDQTPWSPRLVGWSLKLAPSLWVLAAMLALAALWLRRGH